MDLEVLGESFAKAESEADTSHWKACSIAYQAWQTGRPEWAFILSKFAKKSDDQIRHRKNAWVMWLELEKETNLAEPIRDSLSFSHFSLGYKFLKKTDITHLVEAFLQAKMEGLSVAEFAGLLTGLFADDPHAIYIARFGRFVKELRYIYNMSEMNQVPDEKRQALRVALKVLEKKT